MRNKLLIIFGLSFLFAFFSLFGEVKTTYAACTGTGCCCEVSRQDCSSGTCQRVCAEPIQCGWSCNTTMGFCGVPCQGEGWVTSSNCVNQPDPTAPPPGPTQPPGGGSGGCTSGDCFTGISNCGEVGRVGGSGSCSGGLCCAVNTGGGGTTPFGCVMQTSVRNSASAVSYSFGVGQEIFACLYADGDGLITRMTAASQNTGVVQYSGTRSWDGTSYLQENVTYCPGPRGTTVGGGTTRFTMRVYGKKCPACAEELMCTANTNLITVQGAPTPAPSAPTVDLLANGSNGPITIASGSRFTLSWSTANATSCTASGGWSGTQATSGSIQSSPLTSTTSYNINCTGPGGSASDSVTVNVQAATPAPTPAPRPTVDLRVNNSNGPVTITSNSTVTASWSSTNATSCTASGGWSGGKAISGSQSVGPIAASTTLTLTCTGPGGSSSDSVAINTSAPPTVDLRVNNTNGPISITSGQSVTLSWTSSNSSSCTASGGWNGSKATSGSQSAGPLSSTTTFNISCTGPGGTSNDTVTVNVSAPPAAPTVDLRVNNTNGPISVTSGGSVTLSWSSSNATGCTASNAWSGSKATSGSQVISGINSARTFTLACTGTGGNATDSVSVTIGASPPPPAAPTADLRINNSNGPVSINSGASISISWSSTNATSCTASGGWSGSKATSGSQTVNNVTSSANYVLNCTGTGGSVSDTVTVNVTATAQCAQPRPIDPPAPSCAPSGGNGSIAWAWEPVAGATEYDIDIINSSGATVINNGFAPATNFNCASGTCRYTTSLPSGSYRSRIIARGSCTASAASTSNQVTISSCANPAPTVDLRANNANALTITSGSTATLSWSSTNATGCSASNSWSGSKATAGSESTGALTSTRTYTLTCNGAGGSSSDSVTINVNAVPTPPPGPTTDLRINNSNGPVNINSGQNVAVSWSSTNANACNASASVATTGWTGAKAVSGSQTISALTSTRTFNLSCSGPGGNSSDAVTVNVTPIQCSTPPPRDPPAMVCAPAGGNGSITWAWDAVADANQYEVDILNVTTGAVVIDNPMRAASTYGCAGGPPSICRYQTSLPAGTYRSRIRAQGICTLSNTALSNPAVLPACMTCGVNLQPDPLSVEVGQQGTMVANATVTNGNATSVSFSSANSSIASVTSPDNSAPFTSTVTGNAIASTTITATLTANNSIGETCTATDTLTVDIEPPGPWWQAVGADVTSGRDLISRIPSTCTGSCVPYLIDRNSRANPGVAVYGPGVAQFDFSSGSGTGNASLPRWLAKTSTSTNYSYSSLITYIPTSGVSAPGASLNSGTPLSDGYIWLRSGGTMTINSPQTISNKVVLFVDGSLNINSSINIQPGSNGFFLAIVRSDVNVGPSLTSSGTTPSIEGIFIVDGTFRTGVSTNHLRFKGALEALGGVSLQRDLEDDNVDTPSEIFEYNPSLLLLYPQRLIKDVIIWREVSP